MNILGKYLLSGIPREGAGGAGGGGTGGTGGTGGGTGGSGGTGGGTGGTGGTGGGAPWYAAADLGLAPEVQTFVAGKSFPDLKTALKSGMEADNLARSRNVLEKPDPAKLNEWGGWEQLGWVPDQTKYTFKAPEKLPPGVVYSGELFDTVRKIAHENRIPLAAAQKLHDGVWSYMLDGVQKLEASGAKSKQDLETALRQKWPGEDYTRNSELARRAMAAFNPNKDDSALTAKLMGEPALVQMFHAIGEKIGEAHLPGGGGGGGGNGGLPATAAATKAEIQRLQADTAFAAVLNDPRHAQHEDYKAQRQRLIAHLAKLGGA